ncbi:NADPH-dependent L-lysine N(6)-monooxygenase [Priestia megaterium]|nr:NADPH-dependent L-lysine N(6)-monooxygenase [Priestia megaterium]
MTENLYDVLGIGIGPFNLSLAALLDPVESVKAVFFDKEESFEWHPGMLIEGTDLQVPFLADLVTFADPTSHYSFLNYIHKQKRLYPFFFFNRFNIPRKEYNEYAKWVINQLSSCQFAKEVVDVLDGDNCYQVVVKDMATQKTENIYAKHVVMGTGSVPLVPSALEEVVGEDVLHSSEYLHKREHIQQGERVTVVGSGQSAAEIFYDLLKNQTEYGYHLTWFTRSANFQQLEQSKLGQELFSTDYVNYFHSLPFEERMSTLEKLNPLRNGIESSTLKQIYDLLYHRSIHETVPVTIQASTEVQSIETRGNQYILQCHQKQKRNTFTYESDKVILATGYKPHIPSWIERFKHDIVWEDEKRFKVTQDYRIQFKQPRQHHLFTLTNIEHSHGSGATNLGLSVQRNQRIINKIAQKEIYPIHSDTTFQQFEIK